MQEVPIFLVRHAHAGSRSDWDDDDRRRPLSNRGRAQAQRLVTLLSDRPVGRVVSSPARRCIETVEPLARRHGLEVETADELEEGAGGERATHLLRALAGDDAVVCSHGDVIPRVLHRLHVTGMHVDHEITAAKASVWVLETDGAGLVSHGTYLPPAR